MAEESGEVTILLERWREGDAQVVDRLLPLIYPQLRVIASTYMRREREEHTLQPTALVNEVYLRLLRQKKLGFHDRQHFLAFAARMMRNILVDHARVRLAERRGGPEVVRVPLSEDAAWIGSTPESMIDLHDALQRLEQLDTRKAQVIDLRLFLEMTNEEAARVLSVSPATVERDLKFARSWLHRELSIRTSNSARASA